MWQRQLRCPCASIAIDFHEIRQYTTIDRVVPESLLEDLPLALTIPPFNCNSCDGDGSDGSGDGGSGSRCCHGVILDDDDFSDGDDDGSDGDVGCDGRCFNGDDGHNECNDMWSKSVACSRRNSASSMDRGATTRVAFLGAR